MTDRDNIIRTVVLPPDGSSTTIEYATGSNNAGLFATLGFVGSLGWAA
jgi:hypothetical protein